MKKLLFASILKGLPLVIGIAARKHKTVREKLKGKNLTVQIGLRDGSIVRHFVFRGEKVQGRPGPASQPDAVMTFKDVSIALDFLKPNPDQLVIIDAMKNFKVTAAGRDEYLVWFGSLMNTIQTAGWEFGVRMRDGSTRYTNLTNGGPIFVYVKNGKILRTTPIDFDETDAASWTIQARGKTLSPQRRATVSVHALAMKSQVYSDKRLLYPMKRVDFDPKGERNPQNRGKSGYVRISWDDALDIVSNEITRMKREHGPGAIGMFTPAHHQWGNVGYWLSSLMRFANIIGTTRVAFSPISWEGWYWGAQHHYGNNMRVGVPGFYGTVEDCLKEAEMVVFWSSDPESTSGVYGGGEATQRRMWAKDLGIEFVHIDPHLNATAQLFGGKWFPIKAGTDAAMAIAIMYQWIVENLYDKDYVAKNSTGFDEWSDYLMGVSDGVPKTPEWQEMETGIPAKDVRSLARVWGNRKTYLAAGGMGSGLGGACRSATGSQWARCMVQMMAMQGWGKPGINFGNLSAGTPMDLNFYFPGYADGGISGDVINTGAAAHNYQRMPHTLTLNPNKQVIPRQHWPEGIINGHCSGHLWDSFSLEGQFPKIEYPLAGHSRIHMIYRYGASSFGTSPQAGRMIEAYRHNSIEFVVNQSIWMENEVQFADVILPACTALERNDIAESANCTGFFAHAQNQLNHRVILMQHKCIEPLGESKSDYQIFADILSRLGAGAMYTEGGNTELTWAKRVFDSSDLPKKISWKAFIRKGYYVLAPDPDTMKTPTEMRWFAEGRVKDTPEQNPLPGQYAGEMGKGLGTQSSKFEFVPNTLRKIEKDDPDRPAVNRYIPSWEGSHTTELFSKYPLQLITSHPPFSFHTFNDGKSSQINTIKDHRIEVDGYQYWVLRMSNDEAAKRGLVQHDLVKVYNDRAAVICAVDIAPLMGPGQVKAWESCAQLDLMETPEGLVERAGCMNMLTPTRMISKTSDGIAPNSCLVEVTKWDRMVKEAV
ncbi:MAG: pyrogallol hydroxytransferase large subunit [Burkholderiales bacterium RIFOXYD12_FULL_59_19]|nr:MAG: pyrogallol hydroxytransferase large subunit [Burkholderiales bacterium RIFOXYD12_FULL_59_19]